MKLGFRFTRSAKKIAREYFRQDRTSLRLTLCRLCRGLKNRNFLSKATSAIYSSSGTSSL